MAQVSVPKVWATSLNSDSAGLVTEYEMLHAHHSNNGCAELYIPKSDHQIHVIKPMGLHGPSQITSDCFMRVSATTQVQHEFPSLTKPFYIFKLISETCRLCHITIITFHHPYQNNKLQNNNFEHQIYVTKIRGSDSIILPPTRHRKRTCLTCMELLCIYIYIFFL